MDILPLHTKHPRLLIATAGMLLLVAAWLAWQRPWEGSLRELSWEEYPVRGIDISAHNGNIDFRSVKNAGYTFVVAKATEGTDFKDRKFHQNIAAARRAGLKVGAYHFFRFDATARMQALNFLHSLKGVTLDMPPVIDIEDWTNPNDRTSQRVLNNLTQFVQILENNGYPVMLYTNKQGYRKYVERRFSAMPLWICSFTDLPPDIDWTLWQFTHKGKITGLHSDVDINIFNGNRLDWNRWTKKTRTNNKQA